MTIVVIILVVAVMGIIFSCMRHNVLNSAASGETPRLMPTAGLSPVAKALVEEYNELPVEHRPFPDIISVVRDLDAKYAADAQERENHFNYWYFDLDPSIWAGKHKFTWGQGKKYNNCYHSSGRYGRCKFSDYGDIHHAILDIKKSIKDKERAVLASRYGYSSDVVKELTSRLRDEAKLNETFVREFRELT